MKSILYFVESYCKNNNISIHALEKKAGIGNGTIGGWKESKPNLQTLERISKATGIPLSKLVGCIEQGND